MTDRAPKRSYIAMRAYNNDIFSYTTSIVNDFNTIGVFGAVAGANAGNCPQGRILTETGRKLYPGANPGVTHFMVGVFDYATGLSGFIDPNSTAFTPQNTDRPYYFTSPGSNSIDSDPDRAPPVFTRGDILAQGQFDLSGSAVIYGDTTMNSNAQINGNLDLNGNLLMQPDNCGIIDMGTGVASGGFKRAAVASMSYNSNTSLVFLTNKDQNNAGTVYSAEPIGLHSFYIVSNNNLDACHIQYMIVN
jgi:hypothetical protein